MSNIAVIGAGFVGLSSAYCLMREGHQVTVYDAEGPAATNGGASYGNAGTFANYACIPVNNPSVFRDLPRFMFSNDSPFRMRLGYLPHLTPWLVRFLLSSMQRRYAVSAGALSALLARADDGYRDLLDQAGLEAFIRRKECLYLYSGAAAFRASEPALALRRSLGINFHVVSREEVQQLEPQLNPLFDRGVLFHGSWYVSDPGAFLKALQTWLAQSGVHFERQTVMAIKLTSDDGVLLETPAGTAVYDYVAVCAGAYSSPFARQCGDSVPLETERGYHILYPGCSDLISRPVGWAERGLYMTPMQQGLRVAGTVELAGLGPARNKGLLDLLQFSSKRALSALTTPTDTWLGFRPSLPDGLPVIGRSRLSKRVIYAFGHQHIGLTLGGLTGTLVGDLVAQRASPIDLTPYSAARFA
jgi:glycine/D-amino acid oxidase-like deaminating enzyme